MMLKWFLKKRSGSLPLGAGLDSSPTPGVGKSQVVALAQAIEIAVEHHSAGRFGEAEESYRQVLAVDAANFDALHLLGVMRYQLGHYSQAVELITRAIAIEPADPASHFNLGAVYRALNRNEDAIASYRNAVGIKHDYVAAHYNLGNLFHAIGDLEQALACYGTVVFFDPEFVGGHNNAGIVHGKKGQWQEAVLSFQRAIALNPDFVEGYSNLGNALTQQGRPDDGVACCRRALLLDRNYVGAHNNLGNALCAKGNHEEALASYQEALSLNPGFADAHNSLGNLLKAQGRLEEALSSYQMAVSLNAQFAGAHMNLGNLFSELGRPQEAILSHQTALLIEPGCAEAQCSLGNAYLNRGELNEALACYQAALSLKPEFPEARWIQAMAHIPLVYDADADPALARSAFSRELAKLATWFESDPGRMIKGFRAVGVHHPAYLAYQEENNKDLMAAYGNLCAHLMRTWQENQKVDIPATRTGPKISVGIVSPHICNHSVWMAIVKGLVLHLDRIRFDLSIYYIGVEQDQETHFAQSQASCFEQGKKELHHWVQTISGKYHDVLIYPEIGMDEMTIKLASLRLAPVQITTWGQPDSSGLPTMDYFLSAEDLEPANEEGAHQNYTERLVVLPHLGCCYSALPVVPAAPNLAGLHIRQESPLMLCPGTAFKYAPQHDWVLVEIARRLGDCQFIFLVNSDGRENLSAKLRHRLEQIFTRSGLDFEKFVVFLPWQKHSEFYGLMQKVDIFLDTVGFSGFNTAMQAIECGLPIVTRDGRFMRGRLASGILKRMGLPELVANSEHDYISLAVKLARNSEFRQHIRNRIETNRHVLFDDVAPIRALEEFMVNAINRKNSA